MQKRRVEGLRAIALAACALWSACEDDAGDGAGQPVAAVDAGGTPSRVDAAIAVVPPTPLPRADASTGGNTMPDAAITTVPDAGAADSGVVAADPLAPWTLDCAQLPPSDTCRGGPREVLLVTSAVGMVLMFDAEDGHFLNYFKPPSQMPGDRERGYIHVTQGPDQCIWSVTADQREDTVRTVERWNTDGTRIDDIIPRGKYQRGSADRMVGARSLAFTASHVYLAASTHVSRFTLDGAFVNEVVSDSESGLRSVLALGDGSLITGGSPLQRWPAGGGPASSVLTEHVEQAWYAGAGEVLGVSWNDGQIFRVSAETGVSKQIPVEGNSYLTQGVALLGDGRFLYTGGELGSVIAVEPGAPAKKTDLLADWQDQTVADIGAFAYVGRACLSNEFVERKPELDPELPAERCDELPDGTAIMDEGFESGAFVGGGSNRVFNGWQETTSYTPRSELDASEAAQGERSLRVTPKAEEDYATGVAHEFSRIQPRYLGYRIKYAATDGLAKLALSDGHELETVTLFMEGLGTDRTSFVVPTNPDTWVRVQMRDFDWQRLTYDLYVDCKRVGDDIGMNPDAGHGISRIDLYVDPLDGPLDPAYFDDIVIK